MIRETWYIYTSNLYADADARSMTPSRNTRSYTLRSVPSSPGQSFFNILLYSYISEGQPLHDLHLLQRHVLCSFRNCICSTRYKLQHPRLWENLSYILTRLSGLCEQDISVVQVVSSDEHIYHNSHLLQFLGWVFWINRHQRCMKHRRYYKLPPDGATEWSFLKTAPYVPIEAQLCWEAIPW